MNEARRLNKILRLVLEHTQEITLTNGSVVLRGSIEHLNDLDETLRRIQNLRNMQPRASGRRSRYAIAVNELSSYIRWLKGHTPDEL